MKNGKAGRTGVVATQIDFEKAQAINAMMTVPAGILPSTPGDQIKPFAIGLFAEFKKRSKPEVTATSIRRAISAYVHSSRYYLASAQPDAMRHDYEGRALEPVSMEDRYLAQTRFSNLRSKHATARDMPLTR